VIDPREADRFDIVGDVHGMIASYRALVDKLGYRRGAGGWRHPEDRVLVSIGDLVDRGPDPLGCLELTEELMVSGRGLAVLGNHEINLVHLLQGRRNRPHEVKQAETSVAQIEADPERWARCLAFIERLPCALLLDEGRLRLAHAAWDDEHVAALPECINTDELWEATAREGRLIKPIEYVLKGPEQKVPPFLDGQGHRRTRGRVPWWEDYDPDAPTLVFGHYSMRYETHDASGPIPLGRSGNAICTDWGGGYGRDLVAFRYPEREFVVQPPLEAST
jgi:calcineurin-like phosphoesterase family protein